MVTDSDRRGNVVAARLDPDPIRGILPEDFVAAYKSGKMIAFLGSGTSLPAGAPLWVDLIRDLGAFARAHGTLADSGYRSALARNSRGDPEVAAQMIRRNLSDPSFQEFMHRTFRTGIRGPTPLHKSLVGCSFQAIFTTNYDCLIEEAYQEVHGKRPLVLTPRSIDDAVWAEQRGDFYLLKVHGCINNWREIILTKPEFVRIQEDRVFDFLKAKSLLSSFLFVGYSLSDDDMTRMLGRLKHLFPQRVYSHFALIRGGDMDESERAAVSETYGVHFVPYRDHPDLPLLFDEIKKLGTAVARPADVAVEPDDELSPMFDALGWVPDRASVCEGARLFYCRHHAGNEMLRLAFLMLPDSISDVGINRLLAEARRYSDREIFVLASDVTAERIRDRTRELDAQLVTGFDLLSRGVNLIEYAQRLGTDPHLVAADRVYVQPLFADQAGNLVAETSLDAYVLDWLRSEGRNELWVLGEFGMGKTWFAGHFARMVAEDISKGGRGLPFPILVQLRHRRERDDIYPAILEAFSEYGIGTAHGRQTIEWLVRRGKLLIIFDGADECPDALADAQRLVRPQCKVLITCRTHYFETLRHRHRTIGIDSDSGRSVDVVELRGFGPKQLSEALRARAGDRWHGIYDAAAAHPDLWDLARRPLFLEVLLHSNITADKGLTVADLYDRYVSFILSKRWRSRPGGDRIVHSLREALAQFAYQAQCKIPRQITFDHSQIQGLASSLARGSAVLPDPAFWLAALRAESLVVVNPQDHYEFGHLSVQEYLAARHLAGMKSGVLSIIRSAVPKEDWREVLWFYGSMDDSKAAAVLRVCLERRRDPQALFLAARVVQARRRTSVRNTRVLGDRLVSLFCGEETKAYRFLQKIYESLGMLGPAGYGALIRGMESDKPQLRRRCILALYECFGHRAVRAVLPRIDRRNERDRHARWHAAEAAAEASQKNDASALVGFLRDPDVIIRGNMLWALRRLGDVQMDLSGEIEPETIKRLTAIIRDRTQTLHLRSHAALLVGRLVGEVGPAEAKNHVGNTLVGLLKDRRNKEWRGYVCRGLGALKWSGAVPALCAYVVGSGDDEIWLRYGVEAIQQLAEPIHKAELQQAVVNMPERLRGLRARLESALLEL